MNWRDALLGPFSEELDFLCDLGDGNFDFGLLADLS